MKLHQRLWGDEWVEVFYGSIPPGSAFIHRNTMFIKLHDDETTDYGGQVYDPAEDEHWGFEVHHGAIVSKQWFILWGLTEVDLS